MIIGNPTAIAKVAPNAESWSATYSRMRTFVTLWSGLVDGMSVVRE